MKSYQYQIIRYLHDRITGEFVNVGLIMFDPTTKYCNAKVLHKYSRVSNFFTNINGHYLVKNLKYIESEICKRRKSLLTELDFDSYDSIEKLSSSILPKSDAVLTLSEVKKGIDINLDAAFDDLYSRFVEFYTEEKEEKSKTDSYVWKEHYKKYFDRYRITDKLTTHSVKTENDCIEFDKAWKNGVWHCYQTLSFDLKKPDAIKNKVYKWYGILDELKSTQEELKVYLLTTFPKDKNIEEFINEKLTSVNSSKAKVSLVREEEAESFALKVKKEIEKSEKV